ncbi:MAG TPA: class I SAM-dependent methyltransferase [Acetobacteraceae bacterium]|nr:class I SAM-dependent methyltransferase [Acetobacteraceae bacterium]
MKGNVIYDDVFFEGQKHGSYMSSREILPIVQRLVDPRSVCDVGCGVGTWLKSWKDLGVQDVLGLDGSYVNRKQLLISDDEFHPHDLRETIVLDRTFDLVMSLEVAEHLPPDRSSSFVKDLTSIAPLVLFSAAIPHQGGTDHINEQWQSYWAGLFNERGFRTFDVIRPLIWDNQRIERWYIQNIVIYCREDRIHLYPRLTERPSTFPLSVVHPKQFIDGLSEQGTRDALRVLRTSLHRSASRRLRSASNRLSGLMQRGI